jgi:flagellar motor switch protein FliN/FliY
MSQGNAPSNPSDPPGASDAPSGGGKGAETPASSRRGNDSPLNSLRGIEGMGFVLDVPVELTVEIGRKSMRIGEILKLGPGSIVELSKVNGEPLDIYANHRLVARGEAVVVGERYGVRLTEVLVVDDTKGG